MNDEESAALYFKMVDLANILDRALSQIDGLRGQINSLESKVEFLSACAWGAVTESNDGE